MAASETSTFAGLPARGDVTPKVAVLGAPHATPYERGRPSHAAYALAPARLLASRATLSRSASAR